MSFSGRHAQEFLSPLTGRTTTFMVEDRQANFAFARTVVARLDQAGAACDVFDLDAFYSSNSDTIFPRPEAGVAPLTTVRVPEPGSDIETEFSAVFDSRQKVVIIDSLNSFYHLISLEDGSSRGRKLTFAVASLSYFARTNAKAIILTMYRREGFIHGGSRRSISGLSDATASVDVRGEEMTVRGERGPSWPGGGFSIRIP